MKLRPLGPGSEAAAKCARLAAFGRDLRVLLRTYDVGILVEDGDDLVDVLLVDDAGAGVDHAHRREAVLDVVIGEENAVEAVEIGLLVDQELDLAVLDLLEGDL